MSADCIRAICFNITTVNSTAETGYAGKIRLMLVLRQVNTGHSTFHWDANIKRFGVGKQPQIPVFFALIRALTSTLSPAMLVSNSWNLLLNRSFIKKKKKKKDTFCSICSFIHFVKKYFVLFLLNMVVYFSCILFACLFICFNSFSFLGRSI